MRTNSLPINAIRRSKLVSSTETKCESKQQHKTLKNEPKKSVLINDKKRKESPKHYFKKLRTEELRCRKISAPARAITIVCENDESGTESEPTMTSSLCIKIR